MTTPFDPYSIPLSTFPVVPQSQIPGGNVASQSMTINTSLLNFSSYAQGGMFGYTGTPGTGQLFFSVTPLGGTDPYGNTFPGGLSVTQGQLAGVTMTGVGMDSTSTINGAVLNGVTSTQPQISGGTASSTTHIINSAGGGVLSYTQTTTTVSFGTVATGTQWTVPTGVTQIQVQCWGAGGGGDGGQTYSGGSGGGGGEYAEEPHFSVTPGQVFFLVIGVGGSGGSTGFGGSDGGVTSFGQQQVVANPGGAGNNGNPGLGGTGSNNSIHFDGGDGGDNFIQTQDGSGGGGGADTGGAGDAGVDGNGSTGGAGGAAGGGGTAVAGTSGVAVGTSASDVSGVGGGGGGPGSGTTSNTQTNFYAAQFSCSYYGSQSSGNSNQQRGNSGSGTGGTMYQGCSSGQLSVTGDQYSFCLMPYALMESDLSGVTINSVQLQLTNLHSWYNTGCYVILGYAPFTTFAQTGSISGSNPHAQTFWIAEGATVDQTIINGWGTVFQSGAAKCLMFGPSSSAGSPTDLYNYGYFYGDGNSLEEPILAITFTSAGSGQETGGDGGDGQISITYTAASSQIMNASMSPIATTDTFGNTVPAGMMSNNMVAIQPSSSPVVPETWHGPMTLASGWSGGNGFFYRLTPWNTVQIFGSAVHAGFTGTTNLTATALPVGYRPTNTWNIGGTGIPGRAGAECQTTGTLVAINATTTNVAECDLAGEFPLGL